MAGCQKYTPSFVESSRAQHVISPSVVLCNNWYTQYVEMLSHNSKIAGKAAQGSDHSNLIISGKELAPTIWQSSTHSSVTAGSHTQRRVKHKLIEVVKNPRLKLFGTMIAPQVWVGYTHLFFCLYRKSHSAASEAQSDRGDEESTVVRDE